MKKNTAKLLIAAIICCGFITNIYAQKKTIEIFGKAGNLTGSVVGGVGMKLEKDSLNNYVSVKGCYDNKNLFGCFEMLKPVTSKGFDGSESVLLKFDGYLDIGMEGSGFPKGTKARYIMWLLLTTNSVSGMYLIAKLPGYIETEQTGILNLSYKK